MGTAFALMDVGHKCHGLKNPYCCDMDLLDMHVPCVGCTLFFKYLYQSKILSNGVSSLIRENTLALGVKIFVGFYLGGVDLEGDGILSQMPQGFYGFS